MSDLRRDSGTPLYRQVQQLLLARMASGELVPGERLPAEGELAAELGVNRLTLRQAVGELARSGHLTVRHGAGTFVARKVPVLEVELGRTSIDTTDEHLARAVASAGQGFAERLLSTAVDDDPQARHDLGRPRARLRRVETASEVGGETWVLSTYWVVDADHPGLARGWPDGSSLYGAIAAAGDGGMRYAWRSFAAAAATPEDAALLGVPAGSPVLVREGVNVDAGGRPVVKVVRRCRADRARFVVRYR